MIKPLAVIRSRTIRFQLTSLMDLLLIIVFAQFLEFHRSQDEAKRQKQNEIAEARESVERSLTLETENLNALREQMIRDNQKLREQKEEAALVAAEARRRQALTEDLLKKLLKLDDDLVDPRLSPPEALRTVEDAEATARAISRADAAGLLRFLAGYDELLKRAEIWTLHVSDRGDIEIDAGDGESDSRSFRLEADSQTGRGGEFVQQMRTAYSQIPQPKGLVVILVSFSPRAVAGNYQPVLDGMPEAMEWLNKDSAGRTRFEYSVIGAINDPDRDLSAGPSTR